MLSATITLSLLFHILYIFHKLKKKKKKRSAFRLSRSNKVACWLKSFLETSTFSWALLVLSWGLGFSSAAPHSCRVSNRPRSADSWGGVCSLLSYRFLRCSEITVRLILVQDTFGEELGKIIFLTLPQRSVRHWSEQSAILFNFALAPLLTQLRIILSLELCSFL